MPPTTPSIEKRLALASLRRQIARVLDCRKTISDQRLWRENERQLHELYVRKYELGAYHQ